MKDASGCQHMQKGNRSFADPVALVNTNAFFGIMRTHVRYATLCGVQKDLRMKGGDAASRFHLSVSSLIDHNLHVFQNPENFLEEKV
jgi:hypothetical protein